MTQPRALTPLQVPTPDCSWSVEAVPSIEHVALARARSRVRAMAGEEQHITAKDGVERAKAWLEKTGRVSVPYTVYEVGAVPFLTFSTVTGSSYSFDMCGDLHLDGGKTQFFGEIKKYSTVGAQPEEYTEYLAKCYRATLEHGRPYHFMWITWHPFSQTKWARLCDADEVRDAVVAHQAAYCGTGVDIDDGVCADLAARLWVIVLSDRQEGLAMSDEMLGELRKAVVRGVSP